MSMQPDWNPEPSRSIWAGDAMKYVAVKKTVELVKMLLVRLELGFYYVVEVWHDGEQFFATAITGVSGECLDSIGYSSTNVGEFGEEVGVDEFVRRYLNSLNSIDEWADTEQVLHYLVILANRLYEDMFSEYYAKEG